MLASYIAEIQDIKCYMGALIPPPLPEFQNFPESGTKHFWEIYFLLIFPRSRILYTADCTYCTYCTYCTLHIVHIDHIVHIVYTAL